MQTFAISIAQLLQGCWSMHRDKQKLIFWSVRLQFGEAGSRRTPIIMLKNDCGRARSDDSCKLIVLELILLRRIGHDSFAMKAILKHAATTMNALETSDSTRARKLIVMRAKGSLLRATYPCLRVSVAAPRC